MVVWPSRRRSVGRAGGRDEYRAVNLGNAQERDKELTCPAVDVVEVPRAVLARPLAHVAVEPRLFLPAADTGVDHDRLVQVLVEFERQVASLHHLGRFREVFLLPRRALACVWGDGGGGGISAGKRSERPAERRRERREQWRTLLDRFFGRFGILGKFLILCVREPCTLSKASEGSRPNEHSREGKRQSRRTFARAFSSYSFWSHVFWYVSDLLSAQASSPEEASVQAMKAG